MGMVCPLLRPLHCRALQRSGAQSRLPLAPSQEGPSGLGWLLDLDFVALNTVMDTTERFERVRKGPFDFHRKVPGVVGEGRASSRARSGLESGREEVQGRRGLLESSASSQGIPPLFCFKMLWSKDSNYTITARPNNRNKTMSSIPS